jgi:hypothetical protein
VSHELEEQDEVSYVEFLGKFLELLDDDEGVRVFRSYQKRTISACTAIAIIADPRESSAQCIGRRFV